MLVVKSTEDAIRELTRSEDDNKRKVFDGQEPPSGESTTTECGFNYQLLAVMY